MDGQGQAWVTTLAARTSRNAVHKISSSGSLLGSFALPKVPQGLAVDGQGRVWVAIYGSFGSLGTTVAVLANSGAPLYTITVGLGPYGVAVDPTSGAVWVTNSSDATVSLIR